MNCRQRVETALMHRRPDRPPIDLGSTAVTGIHVAMVHKLRQALKLPTDGDYRVKVVEPYQMLGGVEADLMQALGVDCVGLGTRKNLFGFENSGWKPWVGFDGIEMLVPAGFNTEPEPDGDLLQYPEGDRSAPPSGRMVKGGFFHNTIVRQPPIDEKNLRVEDNLEEFTRIGDEDLEHLRATAECLYTSTPYALVGSFGGTAFGDIALVPAPFLKNPKGIRDIEEWYVSTVSRRNHVYEIFSRQCQIALGNLELIRQAVGNKVMVVFLTGTDFGTQNAPFISNDTYRDLYRPFHKAVNDWVHKNTAWKTFIHSCGAVEPLIGEFIGAGFDVLNPVQCSARGMDPKVLKAKYGARITFWGGASDTQRTLPFGKPEDVAAEAHERVHILGTSGGFVFNPIHNIQARTPVENVLALFHTAKKGYM